MKNGYSNGNAGHTRHRTNTNKKKPTENQKGEQHGPHKNPGGGGGRWIQVLAKGYKIFEQIT